MMAWGTPRPISIFSTCALALKYGSRDSGEALVTEKWTILPSPALFAASNSVLVFSTARSKVIRPWAYRIQ